MQKQIIRRGEIKLVGITVRTNNASESKFDAETAKIFPCVKRYFHEAIFNQIKHRVKPGTTLCVYTEYESDFTGDYTYFIGEEVSSFKGQNPEFQQIVIPQQKYALFTTNKGPMPGVVQETWAHIWDMEKKQNSELGGVRGYVADFEVYDERASDPTHQNIIVDIYIGLKD